MKHCAMVLFCVAGALASGCVDLSPVDFVEMDGGPRDARDSGSADAAPPDGSSGIDGEACDMCRATTCPMAVESCDADPKCGPYTVCMTKRNCWNERVIDFNNPPACYFDCAIGAGIMSQVDPALGLFLGVLICAQNQCAHLCAPSYLP